MSRETFINVTPTWGEWGRIYRLLAESGECKALIALREDFARAMASPTFAILTSHFLFAACPSRGNAGLGFSFHFEYAT